MDEKNGTLYFIMTDYVVNQHVMRPPNGMESLVPGDGAMVLDVDQACRSNEHRHGADRQN